MSKATSAAREHTISGFFVFCLIGLFAVLTAVLTLFGVRAYRNVNEAAAMNSDGQIALSYLQNKAHSWDREDAVLLESRDGTEVLTLRERIDGVDYETRIYYYDGNLCECFCEADEPFDETLGEALAPLDAFSMELVKPWLLRVTLKPSGGGEQSAHIALRAGEVVRK